MIMKTGTSLFVTRVRHSMAFGINFININDFGQFQNFVTDLNFLNCLFTSCKLLLYGIYFKVNIISQKARN